MHKPQNGCFPTFLFCDLTGIRRRQELSFMPPLNFGEELKQRGIAWTKIADRQVKYSCQISEEIGRPCRWRKSDVPSACFNPWRQKTQRCLWRDLDQSKEPDVWEFLRYVFGGGGGCYWPFCAQYAWQKHADGHKAGYSLSAEAVKKGCYLDDLMPSVALK